jgi:hypothetical protein
VGGGAARILVEASWFAKQSRLRSRTELRNERLAGLYGGWHGGRIAAVRGLRSGVDEAAGRERARAGSAAEGDRRSRSVARRRGDLPLHRDREREACRPPELAKALHLAEVTGATLLIANLDRLSRNAAFLLTLRDSGVRFVAADMPEANDLTVGTRTTRAEARSSTSTVSVAAAFPPRDGRYCISIAKP